MPQLFSGGSRPGWLTYWREESTWKSQSPIHLHQIEKGSLNVIEILLTNIKIRGNQQSRDTRVKY